MVRSGFSRKLKNGILSMLLSHQKGIQDKPYEACIRCVYVFLHIVRFDLC